MGSTQPFMKRNFFRHGLCAGWLLLAAALPIEAASITWSSDYSTSPIPELLDSSGTPLDASYSFEIGSFGLIDPLDPLGGYFVPTMANIVDWQANWKVFDRSYDPTPGDPGDGDPFGWNPGVFFLGEAVLNALGGSDSDARSFDYPFDPFVPAVDPTDVFGDGEVAYLWAYNSKSIVPGTEWALVMDSNHSPTSWRFTAPTDPDSAWNLATADTAIIGSVNPSSAIALQMAPVPEPGSAFLLFAAAASHLIRRARRLSRTSMV